MDIWQPPTAFNHSSSNDAEAEYDRLRDLARAEGAKRGACFDKVHDLSPQCSYSSPSNAEISRVKPTSVEMEQQRMNCQKRERRMERKWNSSTNKPRNSSLERIMRMGRSQKTPLTSMVNSSRRQKIFWRKGSNTRGRVAKPIFMCMFLRPLTKNWY